MRCLMMEFSSCCKNFRQNPGEPNPMLQLAILLHDPASRKVTFTQCAQLASQLHTATATTIRYVLCQLLNHHHLLKHHPLYTNTTCTHPPHHLHNTPGCTQWYLHHTHLIKQAQHIRRNSHAQYTRTDRLMDQIQTKHHGIHIYTWNPGYIYNSLLHTKTLRLIYCVFPSSCYSAENPMLLCTISFSLRCV